MQFEQKGVNFSSAFNTIMPQQLIHKLNQLAFNTAVQLAVGQHIQHNCVEHIEDPPGMCAGARHFTLLTRDRTPMHSSNLKKFEDDATVVNNRKESNYRSEVSLLDWQLTEPVVQAAAWCRHSLGP